MLPEELPLVVSIAEPLVLPVEPVEPVVSVAVPVAVSPLPCVP